MTAYHCFRCIRGMKMVRAKRETRRARGVCPTCGRDTNIFNIEDYVFDTRDAKRVAKLERERKAARRRWLDEKRRVKSLEEMSKPKEWPAWMRFEDVEVGCPGSHRR